MFRYYPFTLLVDPVGVSCDALTFFHSCTVLLYVGTRGGNTRTETLLHCSWNFKLFLTMTLLLFSAVVVFLNFILFSNGFIPFQKINYFVFFWIVLLKLLSYLDQRGERKTSDPYKHVDFSEIIREENRFCLTSKVVPGYLTSKFPWTLT